VRGGLNTGLNPLRALQGAAIRGAFRPASGTDKDA
jgi:hypothetical protein